MDVGVRAGSRNETRIRVELQECSQTTVENAIKNTVNRGGFQTGAQNIWSVDAMMMVLMHASAAAEALLNEGVDAMMMILAMLRSLTQKQNGQKMKKILVWVRVCSQRAACSKPLNPELKKEEKLPKIPFFTHTLQKIIDYHIIIIDYHIIYDIDDDVLGRQTVSWRRLL